MANKPIFFDATGRRAARIRVLAWLMGLVVLVMLTGFAASLLLSPPVASLNLPGRAVGVDPRLQDRARAPGLLPRAQHLAEQARRHRQERALAHRQAREKASRVLPAILRPQDGRSLAIAF
ncbi:MAG: hypothetical protein EOP38_30205, partial [Rubrivivax sp.]